MEYIEELEKSLITGFIDNTHISQEEFRPSLLINNPEEGQKILTNLINQLQRCEEFYFSVAFITNSGLTTLIGTLKELEQKGIRGKILTSEYLEFTEPKALKRLLEFKNITLKITKASQKSHIKGYIFKKKEEVSIIIGSTNLTQNALCINKEWNIKLNTTSKGEIYRQTIEEFNNNFNQAVEVNEEWILEYEKRYNEHKQINEQIRKSIVDKTKQLQNQILPNIMQEKAVKKLEALRKSGEKKALIISATGTGKTYLSAFDVKKVKPKKLLFIVHRQKIAKQAKNTYEKIFKQQIKMGLLTGKEKNFQLDYIFTTIQTLSKDETLKHFSKDYFDYIIIDEVHHLAANTYQKVLKYFAPQFLLGMSATPERTDGCDIFQFFDHNIAYELRLNDALKNDMLVPFHYYGIADIQINGELIKEDANFNTLVADERVNKIIEASKFYGYSGNRVKGLIFCSKTQEAKMLSEKFNKLGYKTIALDSKDSEQQRQRAIDLLETDDKKEYIEYIFTVDIFNEGIDIPEVNQVIMLRPTQSAIIFVQQLGRGLRKYKNKEYLIVIDFIGNYNNNYLLPVALYGDNSYNKEDLRRKVRIGQTSLIPGVSTIHFEKIIEEKIYKSINEKNFLEKTALIKNYKLLKYKIGKIPKMMDFIEYGTVDPILYADYKNTSYYNFVKQIEVKNIIQFSEVEESYLNFLTKEVATIKRIEDTYILKLLIEKGKITLGEVIKKIEKEYQYTPKDKIIQLAIRNINGEFLKQSDTKKYLEYNIVTYKQGQIKLSKHMEKYLQNREFKTWVQDILEYGKYKFDKIYNKKKYEEGLILYEKYTRRQVLRILEWDKDIPGLNIGGYVYNKKENKFPVFITYNKKEDIKDSINYKQKLIGSNKFTVISKPKRTMSSPEICALKQFKERNLRIPLFIKKSDDEGKEFYYLGNMKPIEFSETTMPVKNKPAQNVISITCELEKPVEENLLNYITEK